MALEVKALRVVEMATLMGLAKSMHGESLFCSFPFDEERVFKLMHRFICHPAGCSIGVYDDDRLVGAAFGEVVEDFWCGVPIGTDHALYVEPGARQGRVGIKLLRAFEDWCFAHGAEIVRPVVFAGINNERAGMLFKALGYEQAGGIYMKFKEAGECAA